MCVYVNMLYTYYNRRSSIILSICKMETVFLLVIIILALLLMLFMLLYFRCNATKLRPDECYNIGGLYLVRPATTAQVMTNCGTSETDICTYPVDSLEEAITICNNNPRCTTFTYDGSQMNIVDQFYHLLTSQDKI